jgi:hypothetical protein
VWKQQFSKRPAHCSKIDHERNTNTKVTCPSSFRSSFSVVVLIWLISYRPSSVFGNRNMITTSNQSLIAFVIVTSFTLFICYCGDGACLLGKLINLDSCWAKVKLWIWLSSLTSHNHKHIIIRQRNVVMWW